MSLAEIFKTEDPDQQGRMAAQLKKLAESPVIMMTLAVDTRNPNQILLTRFDSAGNELDYDTCYTMLEHARKQLMALERQQVKQQEASSEG